LLQCTPKPTHSPPPPPHLNPHSPPTDMQCSCLPVLLLYMHVERTALCSTAVQTKKKGVSGPPHTAQLQLGRAQGRHNHERGTMYCNVPPAASGSVLELLCMSCKTTACVCLCSQRFHGAWHAPIHCDMHMARYSFAGPQLQGQATHTRAQAYARSQYNPCVTTPVAVVIRPEMSPHASAVLFVSLVAET
jgi:hypothetical protein